jgi:hypothetical protein
MKKKLTVMAILILSCIYKINAQVSFDTLSVVQRLSSYSDIFEGEVIDKTHFEDPTDNMLYTDYLIQTNKLFKGTLTCGTVHLILKGGKLADRDLNIAHVPTFEKGFIGVFGTRLSNVQLPSYCPISTNTFNVTLYDCDNSYIAFHDDEINFIATNENFAINNLNDLYTFLQIVCGINYINCNNSFNATSWKSNNKLSKHGVRSAGDPTVISINGNTSTTFTTYAGTNDTLIIKGYNFSDTVGKFWVKNANDGGQTSIALNKTFDILDWKDSTIKIIIPSTIDSVYGTNNSGISGSGIFAIQRHNNLFSDTINGSSAINKFNIKYAVGQNYGRNPLKKYNYLLFHQGAFFQDSAFHFRLHPSITNSNMKKSISAAIKKWVCLTGVNLKLDTILSPNINYNDSINTITMGSTGIANAIAITRLGNSNTCTWSNNVKISPVREMDITIDTSFVYWYDTTKTSNLDSIPMGFTDFYNTILHELGHAIGLDHVNQNNDVMWYVSSEGQTFYNIPCSKRRITLNYNNQSAGDWIVSRSTDLKNTCLTSPQNYLPMKIRDTLCRVEPLKVNEIYKDESNSISI